MICKHRYSEGGFMHDNFWTTDNTLSLSLTYLFITVVWRQRWWECCSSGSILASKDWTLFCFGVWNGERKKCSHYAGQKICLWLQCKSTTPFFVFGCRDDYKYFVLFVQFDERTYATWICRLCSLDRTIEPQLDLKKLL